MPKVVRIVLTLWRHLASKRRNSFKNCQIGTLPQITQLNNMQIICLITALFWESSCNLKGEGEETNQLNLIRTLILIFLMEGNANIPCGFPGRPKWGDVVVSYDKSNSLQQIATYNCPGSYLIDEDVERRCENGKWTGTIPRCGA